MSKHSIRFANRALRASAVVLAALSWAGAPVMAQVSIGISTPGVNIGVNMPVYPELVRVPDYPVYYVPGARTNYFFYDGMYWVYEQDNWHTSSWYNGPWVVVRPQVVPVYVLRIPVRYYGNPPMYFRSWRTDAPPRWGDHWGHEWAQRHVGWDRWDRRVVPAPAPLPVYQRQYTGDRYPQAARQHELLVRNYRYQPRDAAVRQHFQQHAAAAAPAPVPHGQRTAAERPDNQKRPALQGQPHQERQIQHAQPQQPHSQPAAQPQHPSRPPQQGIERAPRPAGVHDKAGGGHEKGDGEGGRQGNR
jgi:hypothetical protein